MGYIKTKCMILSFDFDLIYVLNTTCFQGTVFYCFLMSRTKFHLEVLLRWGFAVLTIHFSADTALTHFTLHFHFFWHSVTMVTLHLESWLSSSTGPLGALPHPLPQRDAWKGASHAEPGHATVHGRWGASCQLVAPSREQPEFASGGSLKGSTDH